MSTANSFQTPAISATLPADPREPPMSQQAAAPFIVRTDQATLNELDAIAATMDRPRDDLVNDALQNYLALNAWQIERIKAGMADAKAGRVRPADEVFADLAKNVVGSFEASAIHIIRAHRSRRHPCLTPRPPPQPLSLRLLPLNFYPSRIVFLALVLPIV